MSKISNKKAECGYEDKPLNKMCSNCMQFSFDRVLTPYMREINEQRKNQSTQCRGEEYTVDRHGVEKNMRCARNGFAIKKTARCGDWEAKAKEVSA